MCERRSRVAHSTGSLLLQTPSLNIYGTLSASSKSLLTIRYSGLRCLRWEGLDCKGGKLEEALTES
jgi:hypothetical protein